MDEISIVGNATTLYPMLISFYALDQYLVTSLGGSCRFILMTVDGQHFKSGNV